MTATALNVAPVSKAGRRESVNTGFFSFLGRTQNIFPDFLSSQHFYLYFIGCVAPARERGNQAEHIATPKLSGIGIRGVTRGLASQIDDGIASSLVSVPWTSPFDSLALWLEQSFWSPT